MLESLEGRRGEVRAKPPIPAVKGLWGRPTAVNNVLTLCAVPMILADGGAAYAALGTGRSRGTQVFQLAGNVRQGGIVELPFGVSPARARRGVRRRDPVRPSGARGAGRRPARRLRAGVRLRRPHGLRGPGRVRRDARARRHRGLRRDRRHGADGALRDGVLLDRVVRQVHAVPRRVHPRRGDHRPDHRRAGRRGQPGAARRPLRHHDQGVAVRDGRADTRCPCRARCGTSPRTSSPRKPSRAEHPYEPEHPGPRGRLRHPGGPRRRSP